MGQVTSSEPRRGSEGSRKAAGETCCGGQEGGGRGPGRNSSKGPHGHLHNPSKMGQVTSREAQTQTGPQLREVDPREKEATGRSILLRVGGVLFSVDSNTIQAMDSDFLIKLADEDSPFGKPDDGIYNVVGADPECFFALLNWFRYGSLPVSIMIDKRIRFEAEADFWGISSAKIKDALVKCRSDVSSFIKADVKEYGDMAINVHESKKHHNYRYDGFNGRMRCVDCHKNCDIDSISSYDGRKRKMTCTKCNKKVICNQPNIGFCHKCSLCIRCQNRYDLPPLGECLADARKSQCSDRQVATLELQAKADTKLKEIF